MIYFLLAVNAITIILAICLFLQFRKTSIVKKQLEELRKAVKKERKNIPLQLATTEQMIYELVRRPNIRFILLIPHNNKEQTAVEIHSSNIPVPLALGMLKATYEGVIDTLGQSGQDVDDSDEEI